MSLLNKNTNIVISQLKDISESIIFSYPITGVSDSNKTILAFIDLQKMNVEDFQEFGIIKFKELLDLLAIAGDEADATLKDGILYIQSENISCKYFTTNIPSIEHCRGSLKTLAATEKALSSLSFVFSAGDLDKIKKASALFKFEDLIVYSEDDKIILKVAKQDQMSSNDFKISIPGGSIINNICAMLSVENLKKIPVGSYNVKVLQNPNNPNSVIIRFDSVNVEGLVFLIATKVVQN
jgi:hypothetical protein